jgi:7-keto-8-aminopelargonate synthetase-like enzyme
MVVAFGLSKSFGATGGAIAAADPDLVRMIELCGGPLSFGGPIPPAALGAAIASADIHLAPEHEVLSHRLVRRIKLVGTVARELGIEMASSDISPVRFVDVGSTDRMFSIVEAMKRDGFYVNGAMFPIVAHGHAGIRFTVTLDPSETQTVAMLERLSSHIHNDHGGRSTDLVIDLTELSG